MQTNASQGCESSQRDHCHVIMLPVTSLLLALLAFTPTHGLDTTYRTQQWIQNREPRFSPFLSGLFSGHQRHSALFNPRIGFGRPDRLQPFAQYPRFPIVCANGGTHIGQCRLQEDLGCLSLGGVCITGACCTNPFFEKRETTTTRKPNIVEGEALRPKPIIDSGELETESKAELMEFRKVMGKGRKLLSDLFTATSVAFPKRRTTTTVMPVRTTSAWLTRKMKTTTTTMPTTSRIITETSTLTSLTSKSTTTLLNTPKSMFGVCSNGLKAIGPCFGNNECPTRHFCEKGSMCCFAL
ncbi:hypothetical protein L596_021738 [Steinernema carpocapsae]|uniref:Uncharacterized protein n=1 Tax=Steinernema carpocapsae TaxID=34508 RepID=A0A4U5MJP2_STECR|nr:hypothetical protein L596_021738 [Steinernema carpocapsae]